jgi:ectoine hydroxylase-related dioxygenase (phytanoyl-CoA dioxygenase family)
MRSVFQQDRYEREITDNGYTIINGFALAVVCDELTNFYTENCVDATSLFTISNWSKDPKHRTAVYEKIVQQLLVLTQPYLLNYRPVMGVYTAKRPGAQSDMLLHQDWSLVDEARYRSVSVWVALCDMDTENGNLQVARYSHEYAGMPRGMHVPVPFEEIREEMQQKYMTDIPLKKGDAIVFDHRLIHASPPNRSNAIRLAAVLALIPGEAELWHYYYDLTKRNELEVLKMDEEVFRQLNFFDLAQKPKHIESLGVIPYTFQRISIDQVKR